MKNIDTTHDGRLMKWGNNGCACGAVSEMGIREWAVGSGHEMWLK